MKRVCRKAIILAAGEGVRVRSLTTDKPKCLMDLAGKPIIEWLLQALAECGITEIVIITGFGAKTLSRAIGDGTKQNLSISYVHNPNWTQPNGLSLYAAKGAVKGDESFLTLMSDHLLPPSIIAKVARARTSRCVLAVDTNLSNVFDLGDATKVRLINGRPAAIGKKLRKYNAIDCGLFRFDKRVFVALEAAFQRGRMTLTDGVKILVANGDLEVLLVGDDTFWVDIDTPRAYRHAMSNMDIFLRTLRSNKGK